MNVIPRFLCISFNSYCIFCLSLASRAESGSSNNKILGFKTIARAIATLCICPPEILSILLFSKPDKLTSFKAASTDSLSLPFKYLFISK